MAMLNISSEHILLHSATNTNDEEDDAGDDSGFGSLGRVNTMSLTSEVTKYRTENYRRYHAFDEDKYFQPNDEQAQEHMDLFHNLCLVTFNYSLFLAPLGDDIQEVLDVGTGTGVWPVAFADMFPAAQVLATDLSPIQTNWPAANCKFEVDDAEQEWTFAENSFDYIHIRGLSGCVKSWQKLYEQCYRCLKPGGYIEQLEFAPTCTLPSGTAPANSMMECWLSTATKAFEQVERDILVYQKMAGWMNEAGFEHATERTHQWPVGTWPEDEELRTQGRIVLEHLTTGLEGWALRPLTAYLG